MSNPPVRLTHEQWVARKKEADRQIESFESSELFKSTVEAKLWNQWTGPKADSFFRCGHDIVYSQCMDCGTTKEHPYHCNLKWCPSCNWRITATRKTELRKLTEGLPDLKHMVLTQRNFPVLTQEKIRDCRKNLLKLRRKKIMGKVHSGCCSLEFTNESAGWHMHWHLLLDVGFICEQELAKQWGKLVGQEYAIVRCRRVVGKDYVTEVCKYVVEGSTIAKWPANLILEFVTALDNTRLFSVYGAWQKLRKRVQAEIKLEKPDVVCACGCTHFIWGDDEAFTRRQIKREA